MSTGLESIALLSKTAVFASFNPATAEVLREFDCASRRKCKPRFARARSAQSAWWIQASGAAAKFCGRFQRPSARRKSEVARSYRRAGKPYAESLVAELMVVLDAARFCCQTAGAFLKPQAVPHGNLIMKAKSGFLLREPRESSDYLAMELSVFYTRERDPGCRSSPGNAVVLKPSELTPLVGLKLEELLTPLALPRDIFQVVIGDGATVRHLSDSAVDKIVFTGSVNTGRRIAQAAAPRFLQLVLELGGRTRRLS